MILKRVETRTLYAILFENALLYLQIEIAQPNEL